MSIRIIEKRMDPFVHVKATVMVSFHHILYHYLIVFILLLFEQSACAHEGNRCAAVHYRKSRPLVPPPATPRCISFAFTGHLLLAINMNR